MSIATINRPYPHTYLGSSATRRLTHAAVLLALAALPVQALLAHGQSTARPWLAGASPAVAASALVSLPPAADPVSLPPAADPVPSPAAPLAAAPLPIAAAVEDTSITGLIRSAAIRHGASAAQLLMVATCESGLDPGAYNRRSGASGLFQFMPGTFYAHGGTDIWSAAQQADIAATMFAAGWSYQWSCR